MRINFKIPFILPLALFFLSGLVGIWSSYNPVNSQDKLLLIASGIFLYVIIAALRGTDKLLILLTRLFLIVSALFALYFDTQNDFLARPSKFNIINQIGILFNNLVPQLQLFNPARNIIVGIMEMALPINIAIVFDVWMRKRRISVLFVFSAMAILFALISSSMRSVIVLGVVSIIAITIFLVKTFRSREHSSASIWILMAVTIISGAGFLLFIIFGLSHVQINGLIVSHMDFNWRTWRLIQAYFFTGSGLGVFSMVFSTYSCLIHVPFVSHAENTFLQIWIEQGLPGFAAFVWLAAAFYVWVWNRRDKLNVLAIGALTATTIMFIHDLIDVRLYSTAALPLIFVPIGLTVASTGYSSAHRLSGVWNWKRLIGAFLVIAMGLLFGWKLIMPAWYTNLASVYQTRLELSQYQFPDKMVEYIRRKIDYSRIESYFRQALALDPGNVSANQRLAIIVMEREDYAGAVKLLEKAYMRDSSDPVTYQLLGTAYLGIGRLDEAYAFWSRLPDAPEKLEFESWIRYGTRGDKERSYQAMKLAEKIISERKLKK